MTFCQEITYTLQNCANLGNNMPISATYGLKTTQFITETPKKSLVCLLFVNKRLIFPRYRRYIYYFRFYLKLC